MKVLIAGATGKTGIRLVNILLEQGHQPIALVRESSDISTLPAQSALRHGDLANLPDDICDGCDAVIFAAGSGGGTGEEMTDKIDRDGAMRLIDIAAKAKVARFVMLSSVGADDPDPDSDLVHYLQAKHDADAHLQASGLSHAIIRPVALTDEDGAAQMRFGKKVDVSATAARGDVALALADALTNESWTDKAMPMQSA